MKKIALFFFVVISVLAQGQDSTQTQPKKNKRFFIGANFSPDLCYRTLRNVSGGSTGDMIVSERNQTEIAKLGFTGGINFCYIISKHISLDADMQYSNKGYQTKTQALTFGTATLRRGVLNNVNISNLPQSGHFVYAYNYLDIPIKVNFVFGKKKVRFISSAGLTTNVLIVATSTFKGKLASGSSVENNSNTTGQYNKINFSPTISFGIGYKINNKMFFRVEPTFRYGILKTVDAPIAEHLWSTGLNCSYYFGL